MAICPHFSDSNVEGVAMRLPRAQARARNHYVFSPKKLLAAVILFPIPLDGSSVTKLNV